MSPRNLPFHIVFSALVGVGLVACNRQTAPPQVGAPTKVTVITLTQQPVTLTRELPGRTSAFLVAEVRPQVSGIVKNRLFTEGGLVKAGEALYQLDDATYRADHASSQAALARARATLNSARLKAGRMTELAKVAAVSRQDDEIATAALQEATADVKAAQAAAQRSAVMLGYGRISAPISGRIGKSSVTQGALVTANQADALATVQQLDPVYVDLTQSSTELLQLRKELAAGTLVETSDVPMTILLEDGSDYEHAGKLAFSDVTVDPATGSYALRVTVPNPDNLLLPGMYVRAVVSLGKRESGVLVPQQGIARDPKGNTTAMVVGADNKVEARRVQVSRTIGDQWLVDGGLAAGDKVIVEGLQKIAPGMPVQATEAAPDAAATATAKTGASIPVAAPAAAE